MAKEGNGAEISLTEKFGWDPGKEDCIPHFQAR
jgi:hypothetical protein